MRAVVAAFVASRTRGAPSSPATSRRELVPTAVKVRPGDADLAFARAEAELTEQLSTTPRGEAVARRFKRAARLTLGVPAQRGDTLVIDGCPACYELAFRLEQEVLRGGHVEETACGTCQSVWGVRMLPKARTA